MRANRQDQSWNVLLVEDDDAMRKLIAAYLTKSGFVVTSVDRAEEVPVVRERLGRPFDVVVSDVHLPGMSGIELATMLLASTPGLPVVLITGDPDEALAREALSRGPVSYLLKPFQLFELEALIRTGMANRQQRLQPPPPAGTDKGLIGDIPADWLEWVDERSYAGVGHGERVARLCHLILAELPQYTGTFEDLQLAAYCHEIGIMSGMAADPIDLAWRGAELLADLGGAVDVARIVRHMHERWDGTGGPDGLRAGRIPEGSVVLSVADALDHYTAAWLQTGASSTEAVDRAIGLVVVQKNTVFSPALARIVEQCRSEIRSICGVSRSAPVPSEMPVRRARIYPALASV
jgi:response regulator RpfG family c-di-GMP phosphodiesterase